MALRDRDRYGLPTWVTLLVLACDVAGRHEAQGRAVNWVLTEEHPEQSRCTTAEPLWSATDVDALRPACDDPEGDLEALVASLGSRGVLDAADYDEAEGLFCTLALEPETGDVAQHLSVGCPETLADGTVHIELLEYECDVASGWTVRGAG